MLITGFFEMFRIGRGAAPALEREYILLWLSADWPRPPNIVLLNDFITLQRPSTVLWEIASARPRRSSTSNKQGVMRLLLSANRFSFSLKIY
jgi:hypothetical protein